MFRIGHAVDVYGDEKRAARKRLRLIVTAVLGGIVVVAIPGVGILLGVILANLFILQSLREKRILEPFASTLPITPISDAHTFDMIRVRGTLTAPTTFRAYLSDRDVAYSNLTVLWRFDNISKEVSTRRPGPEIVIRDATGEAKLNIEYSQLLVWDVETQSARVDNAQAVLERAFPDEKFKSGHVLFKEVSIENGDELEVIGKVEDVESHEASTSTGYRAQAMEPRITLVSRDFNNPLAITNHAPSTIARMWRFAKLRWWIGMVIGWLTVINLFWCFEVFVL